MLTAETNRSLSWTTAGRESSDGNIHAREHDRRLEINRIWHDNRGLEDIHQSTPWRWRHRAAADHMTTIHLTRWMACIEMFDHSPNAPGNYTDDILHLNLLGDVLGTDGAVEGKHYWQYYTRPQGETRQKPEELYEPMLWYVGVYRSSLES